MLRLIERNITVEEYLKIVEAAETAALCDLDPFATFELHDPDSPVFSPLGVKLRLGWPDDKQHTFWDDDDESFLRFPDLMNYIGSAEKVV